MYTNHFIKANYAFYHFFPCDYQTKKKEKQNGTQENQGKYLSATTQKNIIRSQDVYSIIRFKISLRWRPQFSFISPLPLLLKLRISDWFILNGKIAKIETNVHEWDEKKIILMIKNCDIKLLGEIAFSFLRGIQRYSVWRLCKNFVTQKCLLIFTRYWWKTWNIFWKLDENRNF